MSKTLLEAETLDRTVAEKGGTERLVTLTIVHHPEPRRVGDRLHLPLLAHARAKVRLGRAEPLFRSDPRDAGLPLTSPFVSRKPLVLEGLGDGVVRIDASECGSRVAVDLLPVTETIDVGVEALNRGVVVELGSHVVLLLHNETVVAKGQADDHLVGDSDAIRRVRAAIGRIAGDGAAVLVRGETGSGKELVAAAIHAASARRDKPFVAVNMAAVSSTLAASELFGHAKGAFSGADQNHDGFFVRANGGTLFMDEVGDTPNEVQAALLRTLETGEVMPVGGRTAKHVDVRVIAATDADLDRAISDGRFRGPLFYRLSTNEIRIPPLRERRSDIGRLVVHFLSKELAALGRSALLEPAPNDASPWLSATLVARLACYEWPGNVRQLRSVCHALALASSSADGLADDELARLMPDPRATIRPVPIARAKAGSAELVDKIDKVDKVDKPGAARAGGAKPANITPEEVERVLVACDYRLSVAADQLGISRPSMNDLVDKHPRLKRAQNLTASDIVAGTLRAAELGKPLWQVLAVSERGLKQRMTELGLG